MLVVAIALETAVVTTASPVVTDRDENTARHELKTGECEEDLSEESDFPAQHDFSPCKALASSFALKKTAD